MTNTNVISTEKETTTGIPTASILLWLGIGSMIMLFAGLLSGYIVRRAEGNWDSFALPFQFTISTIIILLGSVSVQWALMAIKRNQTELSRIMLLITLGLSFFFVFFQFLGWKALTSQNIFFASKDNVSGSFVYALTGLHLAHLIGGILFLLVVCYRAIANRYNRNSYLGIRQCATYWHFLDLLWVVLFVFLSVWR